MCVLARSVHHCAHLLACICIEKEIMKFEKSAEGYRQREKFLRKLRQRQRELFDIKHDAPEVELEEPYLRGKVRSFVISQRLADLPEGKEIAETLNYVNRRQYSRRGDFKVYHRKIKKWEPQGINLHRMKVASALRKKIPDRLLKHFVELNGKPIGSRARLYEMLRNLYPHKIAFRYPNAVEVVTEDYWVTHRKACLPVVDRELEEIESLVKSHGWDTHFYGVWGVEWRRCEKRIKRRRLRLTEAAQIREGLETLYSEQYNEKGEEQSSPFSFEKAKILCGAWRSIRLRVILIVRRRKLTRSLACEND